MDGSELEEVQQQLLDAEEVAAENKLLAQRTSEASDAAVATRDLQLEKATAGKALVAVLSDAITKLEKLHEWQASVCSFKVSTVPFLDDCISCVSVCVSLRAACM